MPPDSTHGRSTASGLVHLLSSSPMEAGRVGEGTCLVKLHLPTLENSEVITVTSGLSVKDKALAAPFVNTTPSLVEAPMEKEHST